MAERNWRLAMQRRRALHLAFLALAGTAVTFAGWLRPAPAAAMKPKGRRTTMTAHDFSFPGIEGGTLALRDWAGKPLLVANTASFCGFTPQYKDLEAVWTRYRARGLVVLGVPSNDFGQQEPGSAKEIKQFCESYDVSFPLTDKQKVIGPEAHPFYRWIAAELGDSGVPRWNFHKYLIDAQGELAGAWPSRVTPLSKEVTGSIEQGCRAPPRTLIEGARPGRPCSGVWSNMPHSRADSDQVEPRAVPPDRNRAQRRCSVPMGTLRLAAPAGRNVLYHLEIALSSDPGRW